MTVEEIQTFLKENGKTKLPDLVARALQEWSGKRESLVLRRGVTLALAADENSLLAFDSKATVIRGTNAVLLQVSAQKAANDFPGWSVVDHRAPSRVWEVSELGVVQTNGTDVISHQRLSCLAERVEDNWLISEKSVAQAQEQGVAADTMLSWLKDHLRHKTPALLATAIRNWTGRPSAFVGEVQIVRLSRPEAYQAIIHSNAFQPLIADRIPPQWLIIKDEKAAQAKRLLKQLGFRIDATYQA